MLAVIGKSSISLYGVSSMNVFFKVSFFIVYGSFFFLRQRYANPRQSGKDEDLAASYEVLQEAVDIMYP